MKDARGHGSDQRGGGAAASGSSSMAELDAYSALAAQHLAGAQAAARAMPAHQSGVASVGLLRKLGQRLARSMTNG